MRRERELDLVAYVWHAADTLQEVSGIGAGQPRRRRCASRSSVGDNAWHKPLPPVHGRACGVANINCLGHVDVLAGYLGQIVGNGIIEIDRRRRDMDVRFADDLGQIDGPDHHHQRVALMSQFENPADRAVGQEEHLPIGQFVGMGRVRVDCPDEPVLALRANRLGTPADNDHIGLVGDRFVGHRRDAVLDLRLGHLAFLELTGRPDIGARRLVLRARVTGGCGRRGRLPGAARGADERE